ncbi:acylphosphatase [Aliidiomarina sp. Khilg15.8]
MQRWTLLISGRVQGVFFRKATAEMAQTLDITGYVRNCEDGRVEVVAEGEKNQLQQLHDWCWQGPERARVDDIELTPGHAEGKFKGFVIRD